MANEDESYEWWLRKVEIELPGDAITLASVPEEFLTYDLCLKAVERCAAAFKFVPKRFVTLELCFCLVRQNGYYLAQIPEEFKTYEICMEAVIQFARTLDYVPEELKTPELCSVAVKQDRGLLDYVPKEFLSKNKKILTSEKLKEKYSKEELLTSSNAYLRKLGASNV